METATSTSDVSETHGLCPLRGRCEPGAFCVTGKVAIEGQRVAVETGMTESKR
jgi:hypothetical protein